MNRTLVICIALYTLVVAGLATRSGALLALALPLLVYLGAALVAKPSLPALRLERRVTERVAPGEVTPVQLVVTNDGATRLDLVLEDQVPAGLELAEGQPTLLAALAPGERAELSYAVRGERGLYRYGAARVTLAGPLGLRERRVDLAAPGQIFVLPLLTRLRRIDIRPRRIRNNAGLIPARQGGPGIEFFGVREYQPGDPTRWINGRVTARYPEALFVNEFEQERVADIGIILDARRGGDLPELFERAVEAAAALADALLDRGNRVGLLVYGYGLDWTFPGYGRIQRERIMRALARAHQGNLVAFETLENLPTRQFPSRSQLILISPLQPGDVQTVTRLRAHGYEVLLISPDPASAERERLVENAETAMALRLVRLERGLLLRRVRGLGVRVVDWQLDIPFQQVAEQALGRPFIAQ